MSDKELEAMKRKRFQELQKRAVFQEQKKEPPRDANAILNRIFVGRAWEVFNTASVQFPSKMVKVKDLLVRLALEGKITDMDGEQLYGLLREIGLPVRLNTTIKIISHGKTKSLSEKFRESTK